MRARKNREIMVFSISFLDVIASALGAILILFIIQYQKTMTAKAEASQTEMRHTQCTEVLQWAFDQEVMAVNNTVHPNIVQEEKLVDKSIKELEKTELAGIGFKKEAGEAENKPKVRIYADPEKLTVKKPSRPSENLPLTKDRKDTKIAPMDAAGPDKDGPSEKTPMSADIKIDNKILDVAPMMQETIPGPKIPVKTTMSPGKLTEVDDSKKKTDTKDSEKNIPKIKDLPNKPAAATLATCITTQDRVSIQFYDHDEPDGDTILVTFNGRYATKIRLEKTPSRIYHFTLQKNKYNIIVIKNLSNGFYPVNTAYVQVSGCGRARWQIKEVGASRAIYIYRK